MPKLYLIPNLLSESPWQDVLPAGIDTLLTNLSHFIVEDVRNARRFLKKVNPEIAIDSLTFYELNKFTTEEQKASMVGVLEKGSDAGLLTEAGCPGVADPGADIVRMAHQRNITVKPLTGPSSVLLALMASGLNGQHFVFTGYLPVKQDERIKRIRQLEKAAITEKETQIFIETPYRNNPLVADLLKTCQPSTLLCIAVELTSENEFIRTQSIGDWKNKVPDLDKKPAIFLLGVS